MTAWQRAYGRSAVWFLLPAGLLLSVFVVWPLLRAFWFSFHEADLLLVQRQHLVGLANYSELLGDPRFRRAFANTALFAVLVVPVQSTLAFLFALWVHRPEPAWRMLQAVFFLPTVVSMPVLDPIKLPTRGQPSQAPSCHGAAPNKPIGLVTRAPLPPGR